MKFYSIAGAFVGLCCLSACVSTGEFRQAEVKRNAEIAQIQEANRIAIAELNSKIEKLTAELKNQNEKKDKTISLKTLFSDCFEYNRPNNYLLRNYMESIALPEKPTPKQVREYLASIYLLKNMNVDSSSAAMANLKGSLTALGRDYLRDMLLYADFRPFQEVLQVLLTKEDKPLLKQMIQPNSNNAYSLVSLFASLADKSDKEYLVSLAEGQFSSQMLPVLVRLGLIKEVLPVLKERILSGRWNGSEQVNIVLNNLDEKELEPFMVKFWARLMNNENNNIWGLMEYGISLAKKGFVPAFLFLAENSQMVNDTYRKNQVLSLSPVDSIGLLKKWTEENKGKIKFNARTGKFEAAK